MTQHLRPEDKKTLDRRGARKWVFWLVTLSLIFGMIVGVVQAQEWLEIAPPMHERRLALIVGGQVFGATMFVLIAPAFIPLCLWAIMRFKADRGLVPLYIWTWLFVILVALLATSLFI